MTIARRTVFVMLPSEKLGSYGIASEKRATRKEARTLVVGDRRRSDKPRKQAVGHTGHGVLFHQHRRNAPQRREQDHGTRAVATDTDHNRRPPPGDQPPRGDGARRQQRDTSRQ